MAMGFSRDPATAQTWAQDNSGISMDPRWGDLGGYGTPDTGQMQGMGASASPMPSGFNSASDQWMAAQRRIGYDPMTGGATSLATGSSIPGGGGGFNADKQLAAVRSEFDQILKRGQGQLNEDLAARGIYSGGVGADLSNQYRTQVGNQQSAAIERIMNDVLGRNQQYDLQKSMMEWQKQLSQGFSAGRGAGDTFGSGGQDAQILDMWNKMFGNQTMGASGEGYQDGGIAGGGGEYAGGKAASGPTRRDASSNYYRAFGRWPTPSELDAYMNNNGSSGLELTSAF